MAIWSWASTMTIKESHGALCASCPLEGAAGKVSVVIVVIRCLPRLHSGIRFAWLSCANDGRTKLVCLLRILPQTILDQPVYRSFGKRSVGRSLAGYSFHQQLDSFVDVADVPDVETSRPHRFDYFLLQHHVLDVCRWHHHALLTRHSSFPAQIIKSLDLACYSPDCLHLAVLVHGASHGDCLFQRHTGKG